MNFTYISLLKNVTEIKDVKIKLLPIPDSVLHKDFEWITDEYKKWSKQFSGIGYNPRCDELMMLSYCLIYSAENTPKEKTLKLVKATDITFYIDQYLLEARKQRSEQMAKQVIQNLIKALKYGECDQQFIPGQRFISSLEPVKQEMSADQWLRAQQLLEEGLLTHLEFHCNYWLQNKTVPMNEYVLKRFDESAWKYLMSYNEYAVNVVIPTHIWNNQMVKTFHHKIIEFGLATDDYYMAPNKILSEDMTTRVFCLLSSKGCTLQEAFDLQFEYTMDLYKECIELRDKICADKEIASDELKSWINQEFNAAYCIFKICKMANQIEVDDNLYLNSITWDHLYDDLVSKNKRSFDAWYVENGLQHFI